MRARPVTLHHGIQQDRRTQSASETVRRRGILDGGGESLVLMSVGDNELHLFVGETEIDQRAKVTVKSVFEVRGKPAPERLLRDEVLIIDVTGILQVCTVARDGIHNT